MHDVTGEQTPPLALRDQRAFIAQQQATFVAQALECDQQCADRQKCPQAAPVEMQEPEPRNGRRDNGKNPFVLS